MSKVTEAELQEGYTKCSICSFDKASVHFRKAVPKTWWSLAEPEHLLVKCVGCSHETFIRPGTLELKSTYFGGP